MTYLHTAPGHLDGGPTLMALSADLSDGPAADRIERAMPIAGFVADRFLIDQMLRATRRFGGDFEALVVWSVLGHLNVAHLESPASPPAGAPADSPWPGAALRPMRLRDLSRICGIPRETVRRKLAALQRDGRILRVDTGWVVDLDALDPDTRRFGQETVARLLQAAQAVEQALCEAETAGRGEGAAQA
jgi:hypothetical protein